MTKTEILQQFEFYREADPEQKRILENGGQVVRLEAGKFFALEGCPIEGVALVGDGRLRVFKSSSSGREITLYRIEPGESCVLTASVTTIVPA